MAEHEVGLFEEADDVVPDQRLDRVGADAGVVARGAAVVGSACAGAGVAADGPVLDRLVEGAAVGVAAGAAADLAFEEILVPLAARVAPRKHPLHRVGRSRETGNFLPQPEVCSLSGVCFCLPTGRT